MDLNKERITKFAYSLGSALYDKELELSGENIVFFLDADVVLKLVLGFESDWYDPKGTMSRMGVARSLFSIGYFGKFYMLRPHAFEFYEKIKVQPRYQSIDSREHFRQEALAYIEKTGIHDVMERLNSIIIRRKYANDDALIREFLDVLRENPGEVFSLIENINGTWSERLKRFFEKGLLSLELLGPEISELVLNYKEDLFSFNGIIRERRDFMTVNAFQDAAALTIIRKYILERENGDQKFLARFYTETTSLNDILDNNQKIKEALSYSREFVGKLSPSVYRSVKRNSDYFIIRALFTELKPNAANVTVKQLDSLKKLYHELVFLLEESEMVIEDALSVKYGEKSLVDILDNFEKLSLMEPLWIEGGIPAIINKIDEISGWTKIFQFAQGSRTGIILHAEIDKERKILDKHVSKIRAWTDDFKSITKAQASHANYFEKIEDPMRDLGLIRWNYMRSDVDINFILLTIKNLCDEDQLPRTAGLLASSMEIAKKDIKECDYVCAILWVLGLFKEIIMIVDECRLNNRGIFPSNLISIQFASTMRSGNITTKQDRRKIISKVNQFLGGLSKEERKGALLGAGYTYYHAWRQEMLKANARDRLWDNQPQDIREWAEIAFGLGEEAFKVFEENTLPWAYAVNHCAYVIIATGIVPQEQQNEYLQILTKLKMYKELWCARFDDTLGYYYLDHAERVWYLSSDEQKKSIDLTRDIQAAFNYFESAKILDAGDTDLYEHITRLEILQNAFDDFRKKQTEMLG